jgi:putative transposase
MAATRRLAQDVGARAACEALSIPRASSDRDPSRLERACRHGERPASPLAVTCEEQRVVLALLHAERCVDQAPPEVSATLLDEGIYHGSIRTMYRLLAREGEVRERRGQRRRLHDRQPELWATGPNQVWSWDITKLKGPVTWSYYYLYVMLDIDRRDVVGWMVAHRESAALARKLMQLTCDKQGIRPGQLTIHADRGRSMTSKPVAWLLADLGVTKTHRRPQVRHDHPYAEAQFKTLKYRPTSRSGLAAWRMPEPLANHSLAGTTPSIGIPASACSPLRWCMTDEHRRSWRVAQKPCKQLSRHILSASKARNQHHSPCPRPYG